VADDERPATPKGAARREAIVRAAAGLAAGEGPDAVSHRSVAAAAGVPLAATTYYFSSLAELLIAAVELVVDEELGAGTTLVEALPRRRQPPHRAAQLVVDVVLGPGRRDDEELLAHYERFLAGGRHPELRPTLQQARRRVDALLADALDRCGYPGTDVGHLVAVLDGTVLSALVEGDGAARARAVDAVAAALRAG
jgi:DNA-binding transcriptional regulator YbjK